MEMFIKAVMRLAARTMVKVARAFRLRPLKNDCLSIRKNIAENPYTVDHPYPLLTKEGDLYSPPDSGGAGGW
jgi:hypothetical protein